MSRNAGNPPPLSRKKERKKERKKKDPKVPVRN
jgi:hypothetical protein